MDSDQPVNRRPGLLHSHTYSGFSDSPAFSAPIMVMEVYEAIPRIQTASKLPSYRAVDALLAIGPIPQTKQNNRSNQSNTNAAGPTTMLDPKSNSKNLAIPRSNSSATAPRLSRHLTFPLSSPQRSLDNSGLPVPKISKTTAAATTTPTRYLPAALGRNKQHDGINIRGHYEGQALGSENTTQWIAQQSILVSPENNHLLPSPVQQERPSTENKPARNSAKASRGSKQSARPGVEMPASDDPDTTIRGLDGIEDNVSPRNSISQRRQHQTEQDEQTASDESDLFLNAARAEEKTARQNSLPNLNSPSRIDSRFSRSQRAPTVIIPSTSRRRDSSQEKESPKGTRAMDEQESIAKALTYPPEDINRNRYISTNSRSNPTTPRIFKGRESSPELPTSYSPRRAIPESSLSARSAYRQSNLSYTTPRVYNSSPLVSRMTDMDEIPETTRAAEGTESSVSTTAPSTVWDELEDLKSRIHRLELTGKLPPTSGAAMSRASHDRPPTATTTVTTISTSPKRARGNSVAKSVPQEDRATATTSQTETHPLLHDALAKSKSLLSPEVFKALEAATNDALAIASMMGISGQPGPISSAQSTVGGPATVSDRQVRRKADGLCRSLTELCLALSEAQPISSEPASVPLTNATRPVSKGRNEEVRQSIELPAKRPLAATDFLRAQSTPRALSRLEERRSSLLNTSNMPHPRYNPSEAGSVVGSGRRTSLFLRTSRRTGTDEPEEEGDEFLFRAPSRAGTEIGRLRSSPREYTPKQSIPERQVTIQSSLPLRRHYTTGLTNTIPPPMPPISNLGGRRFLERSTPERDTSSVVSRINEAREQRKSSIGQGYLGRTGSLTKKSRQSTPNDLPSAAQQSGNYQ